MVEHRGAPATLPAGFVDVTDKPAAAALHELPQLISEGVNVVVPAPGEELKLGRGKDVGACGVAEHSDEPSEPIAKRRRELLSKLRELDTCQLRLVVEQDVFRLTQDRLRRMGQRNKDVKWYLEPVRGAINDPSFVRERDASRAGSPLPHRTSGRLRSPSPRLRNSPTLLSPGSPFPFAAEVEPMPPPKPKTVPPGSKRVRYQFCLRLVREFMRNKECVPFMAPITELWPVEALPGYFDTVKKCMDLRTVRENLEAGVYACDSEELNPETGELGRDFDYAAYAEDMRTIFRNAMLYNKPGDLYYETARKLLDLFEHRFLNLPEVDAIVEQKSSSHHRNRNRKGPRGFRDDESRPRSSTSHRVSRPKLDIGSGKKEKVPRKSGKDEKMTPHEVREFLAQLTSQKLTLESMRALPAGSPRWSPLATPKITQVTPMNYEEKRRLSENIQRLQTLMEDKLAKLIQIASNRAGQAEVNQNEEIELDIDKLDDLTLREMEAYADGVLARRKGALKKKTLAQVLSQIDHYENLLARKLGADVNDDTFRREQGLAARSSEQPQAPAAFEDTSSSSSGSSSGSESGSSSGSDTGSDLESGSNSSSGSSSTGSNSAPQSP
ncbi:Bromodomain testis-specific protein [Porphyridium purpureum]|uniref:Bromodomain testis-specific protein n=1 Tax=Porphyridium purpureum TaxID=35688 RepID=A0A5J4YH46_PORPP|nr:Bromodomain testis-specific protein [Porphyridium purpureum]|eukprot:POR0097..scf251_18